MKIERIQIKNIGPYVDENCFKFDVNNLSKRMVLVGGKTEQAKQRCLTQLRYVCMVVLPMVLSPIMLVTMPRLKNHQHQ